MDYSLKNPSHGCVRVSQQLSLMSIQVSSGGVRGVWQRNNLETKYQRLMRLEEYCRGKKIELTEDQVKMLERFDPEFKERHIETRFTGDLVSIDTFLVGTLKGVGKVIFKL